MAKVQSRPRAGGRIVVVEDVRPRETRQYITIQELLDWLEHAGLTRVRPTTVLYWIRQGYLPASKAGDGLTAAWLIRRDTARRFVDYMRARHGGEILKSAAACAYLGEKIGRGGPLSHNTLLAWVRQGILYPANPGISSTRFSKAELDDFAAWFERVKVWRYGRWSVPFRAERPFWSEVSSGKPVEVGRVPPD